MAAEPLIASGEGARRMVASGEAVRNRLPENLGFLNHKVLLPILLAASPLLQVILLTLNVCPDKLDKAVQSSFLTFIILTDK